MRKFGLIGYPLGHSFSRGYFTQKFATAGITDCVYSNYEMPSVDGLEHIFDDPALEGVNVTIPHKKAVLSFLDIPDPVVVATGACNCIRRRNGRYEGFNTDVTGFDVSLGEKLQPDDKRALVLGTGGSSVAVVYVLQQRGITVRRVSRQPGPGDLAYGDLNESLLRDVRLIVNCTPAGMHPDVTAAPPFPYELVRGDQYLFDLIYNPEQTTFLRHGEARGARTKNGRDMLVIQAEESWKIWNR